MGDTMDGRVVQSLRYFVWMGVGARVKGKLMVPRRVKSSMQ